MCGVRLRPASDVSAGAQPGDASPDQTYLAERIRNTKTPPDSERKQVTVLFADLVGSTALIGKLDPERAAATLDPSLQVMVRAVREHGGLVVRIQGDGIMALFSVPAAQEDHAARACLAALAIRDALTASGVPARVGVNSGEVVLRATRGDLVVDYDAVGITVHLAARIEHHAKSGSICIGAATAHAVAGLFELRSHGPVALKGIRERAEVFELLRNVQSGSRWQTRVLHGLVCFVGRERELAALTEAAREAQAGSGRIIVVCGAAGSGKSRLVHEAAGRPTFAGWLVLEASARSEEMRTSYRPLAAMLRAWLEAAPGDHAEEIAPRLHQRLDSLQAGQNHIVPALLNAMNLPLVDATWQGLDPAARKQAIIEAFRSLFFAMSRQQPVLLLVEDVHWADQETLAVLDALADSAPQAPLLMLATCRVGRNERSWKPVHSSRINLAALDKKNARRLAEALLGVDPDLSSLLDKIISRADGIPLFIEEMIRGLADAGELAGKQGGYRLAGPVERVRVPGSIQTVLAARFDRLPAGHKHLLQVAATIGQRAPVRLLSAVLGLPDAQLRLDLDALQAAGLVVLFEDGGQRSLVFRHALMQEVMYDSMLLSRRQELHAAIANAIESALADFAEDYIEALGRHTLEAGLWQRAAGYLNRAAQRALSRSAHDQAIGFIEDALRALHQSPESTRETIEQEIELRLMMRLGFGALGRYREWLNHLDEAERLARNLDDVGKQLAIRVSRLHLLNGMGAASDAVEAGEAAVRMATSHGDIDQLVSASFFLGQALAWHGQFRHAITTTQYALASLADKGVEYRGTTTGTPSVLLHSRLAFDFAMLGEFNDASRHGRQACDIAATLRRGYDKAYAAYGYGSVCLHRETMTEAIEVLEAGLATAAADNLSMLCAMLGGTLGCAYLLHGQPRKAQHHTEGAVKQSEALAYLPVWPLFFHAFVQTETGQVEEATKTCRIALKRAQQKQHVALLAWARWLYGRIALKDNPIVATRRLSTAARMAGDMGMLPLLARCQMDLGAAAKAAGRQAQSVAAAEKAQALWTAIGLRSQDERIGAAMIGV